MAWNNLYSLPPTLRKIIAAITPRTLRSFLRVNYITMLQMGHLRSARTRRVLWQGKPCPWFTGPAIEYLEGLELAGKSVFEFGSGFSSVYWANVGARVITIDDDPQWHAWIKTQLPEACEALVEVERDKYVASIERGGQLDIVVVDGVWREACAVRALQHLKPTGMIILDNSDWYPHVAGWLREANLIQVDFHGFAPGQDFRTTTSFFLNRGFDFRPRGERQPLPPIGGMPQEETHRIWPPRPPEESKHSIGADLPPPS